MIFLPAGKRDKIFLPAAKTACKIARSACVVFGRAFYNVTPSRSVSHCMSTLATTNVAWRVPPMCTTSEDIIVHREEVGTGGQISRGVADHGLRGRCLFVPCCVVVLRYAHQLSLPTLVCCFFYSVLLPVQMYETPVRGRNISISNELYARVLYWYF